MRKPFRGIFVGIVAMLMSWSALAADTLPDLPVETLSKTKLVLPTDLAPGPHLFIVGFSRASQNQTKPWSRRIREVFGRPDRTAIYSVAVLDVPGFVRRFVVRGIREGVSEALRGRFLVATEQIDAWKELAAFNQEQGDAAYLVLVDGNQQVTWRSSGALTNAGFRELASRMTTLGFKPDDRKASSRASESGSIR